MISIRDAKINDAPAIVELWKEFMRQHHVNLVKANPKVEPHVSKKKNASIGFGKFLRKNIRSKNSAVHIAESNGKPIGYSLIYIKDNIPGFKLEKLGYISDIFVKKEFRGKGISSKLKDKAIQWFRKNGIKHISLEVDKDNKLAHSIYKKWGFFDFHIQLRRRV